MRLHGLTKDELAAFGDPDKMAVAVQLELNACWEMFTGPERQLNTDESLHQALDDRLALHADGPEKEAIKAAFNLLRNVIDAGESPCHSDDEVQTWLRAFCTINLWSSAQ